MTAENVRKIPDGAGLYILFGEHGSVLYIGSAAHLRRRLEEQLHTGLVPAVEFSFHTTSSVAEAQDLERSLVEQHLPRYNAA